ncbi:BRO-N domain-containing protein [Pseudomonas frederiksbergensis]|uniref:BRO-N domain-containing protein n=1 Tax=Pseudomonas frederiksbergensis TaxID=104087 RepID=UPI003D1ADFE0
MSGVDSTRRQTESPSIHTASATVTATSTHLTPIVFTRHNRPLHAIWLESQAWFCARDLGRLLGRHLESHALRKLDADQTRTLTFLRNGTYQPTVMINESAAYTTLVHHYTPENRNLRQWLTNEVIAVMRDEHANLGTHIPSLSLLKWAELSVSMLQWQNEPWIRLRDLPEVLTHPHMGKVISSERKRSWWDAPSRFFRF